MPITVRSQAADAWCKSGEHCLKILSNDLTVEAESPSAAAQPHTVRLTRACVVGVKGLGDAGQVVGLLTDTEPGNREHALQRTCASTLG